jgi:hypothetical protein
MNLRILPKRPAGLLEPHELTCLRELARELGFQL